MALPAPPAPAARTPAIGPPADLNLYYRVRTTTDQAGLTLWRAPVALPVVVLILTACAVPYAPVPGVNVGATAFNS